MTPIDRIRAILPDDTAAALVTSPVNRRYLSGFSSSAGAVLITTQEAFLLVDFRYYEAACRACKELNVIQYKKLFETLNLLFLERNITSVFVEDDDLSLAYAARLREGLTAQLITPCKLSDELRSVRMIKTPEELACIEEAQRITERAYTEVLNSLRPGVEERQIAVELEHLIKLYGGERVAFDLICITGSNTSLPHGVPGERIVQDGDFFTFDIGAVFGGYHSDMTRTVAVGHATDKMRKIYDIVLTAHKCAADAIRPGATSGAVDDAARSYIESKGYGDYFGHSTGHGVGLEIHEQPAVYRTDKTVLQKDMVITDEPGIYLPSEFGVRIEDMYVITADGARSLANIGKELEIIR